MREWDFREWDLSLDCGYWPLIESESLQSTFGFQTCLPCRQEQEARLLCFSGICPIVGAHAAVAGALPKAVVATHANPHLGIFSFGLWYFPFFCAFPLGGPLKVRRHHWVQKLPDAVIDAFAWCLIG